MTPETPGSPVPLMSSLMPAAPVTVSETDNLEVEASFKLKDKDATEHNIAANRLANTVRERFERAKTARQADEQRWIKCYYNYRGNYSKDFQFTAAERSRVFVKVTKTKVLAAYGQILDVLLAGNKFPLTVDPTAVPEGVSEAFHIDLQELKGPQAANPAKQDLAPDDIGEFYRRIFPDMPIKDGEGPTPVQPTFYPAYKAAKKMERRIHDQLEESNALSHLRHAAFEMALLGTGILKGPMAVQKEYPKYNEKGEYDPVIKTVPEIASVSVWDGYPDPEGVNTQDCNWFIQRHLLTKSQMRKLKKRPHFIHKNIDDILEANAPGYEKQWWENELNDSFIQDTTERYEVLEYWGTIDKSDLEDMDVEIPANEKDADEYQVNVWVAHNRILRCVFNPFKPARIPYHACPYELNPYNFFGVGVAENMEDSQTLMNGFARMAIDNAVLAGNVILEVDETNLVPGQNLQIEPGKVFRRSGGPPGQAIFATKWQSTAQENMLMFDKFRQLADETVGIPSYAHGQTGVSGITRTAAGMSMLMGASSLNIKTVIKNVDDYLLRPLGEAFFAFNMQFDFDPEIKGDLEVKARGTAALMKKEIQSQRLLQLLQITAHPMLINFVKVPYLLRNLVETMDIDPDKVINNIEEAQVQAAKLGMIAQAQSGPASNDLPQEEAAVGQDTSGGGGGNIGVGSAPQPGEQGFSAAPQNMPTPETEGGAV